MVVYYDIDKRNIASDNIANNKWYGALLSIYTILMVAIINKKEKFF